MNTKIFEKMKTVMIYHDNLYGEHVGSTEKLLQNFALNIAKSGDYKVIAVYGKNNGEYFSTEKQIKNLTLVPFYHSKRQTSEPFNCIDMNPDLSSILEKYKVNAVITCVWSEYQFPIINIPSTIPILLISPFGHYCSNGNVRKMYVSGVSNTLFLNGRRVKCAEKFYNPLKTPRYNKNKGKNIKKVIFGRTGRPDENIFDPISIKAFSLLEKEYGSFVEFRYANPSKSAYELARKLNIKNIIFYDWLDEQKLSKFYQDIHVFAHSRIDGETIGISIAEAMLNQCPIITHISKYHNDHINFLSEPYSKIAGLDNYEEYYQHMKWFVENKEQISNLGLQSRNVAIEIFDEKNIWNKVLKDVSELVSYYGKPISNSKIHNKTQKFRWMIKKLMISIFPNKLQNMIKKTIIKYGKGV